MDRRSGPRDLSAQAQERPEITAQSQAVWGLRGLDKAPEARH